MQVAGVVRVGVMSRHDCAVIRHQLFALSRCSVAPTTRDECEIVTYSYKCATDATVFP